MKKRIMIDGMSCGHCAGRISEALLSICGVSEVEVSVETKSAVVELAHEVKTGKFIEAIDNIGMGYTIKDVFDA